MFDKLKLNLYADRLVGYAYDVSTCGAGVDYTIYLVVLDVHSYKFVKLSKVFVYDNIESNKLMNCFKEYNIKYITCWLDSFIKYDENILSNDSRNNVLRLVKKIPKERKFF